MAAIQIGGHRIGPGSPTFVIAEVGVNHNGDLQLAHRLIEAAVEVGADAVKFQTFTPGALASPTAPQAAYQQERAPATTQVDMLATLALDAAAHADLRDHAARAGILFMSSPFDEQAVDLLDELGVAAVKIPSGEITNHALLRRIAATGRPMVMSTGMATLDEVSSAVEQLGTGRARLALLHCVSTYPADPADCNLRAIETLRSTFDVPAGWSDHTTGIVVAQAAVALGANVVEKHITLDRGMAGPDHAASIEPDEFKEMVEGFRSIEAALGGSDKRPTSAEVEMAAVARKSLHWRQGLEAGARISVDDLMALRPGTGISPTAIDQIAGQVTAVATIAGSMVSLDQIRPVDGNPR